MTDIKGYNALVTGGTSGMGWEYCRQLAAPLYQMNHRLMKLGVAIGLIRTPQWIVKRALRGMMHYRHVVKPGAMNYIVPMLIKLLPNWIELKIWNKVK